MKAFEVVTHGRIDGPSEVVQDSPERGDDTDDQTVTVIQKDKSSQRLSLVERKTTDVRHVNLISAPRMMRSTPDDPQDDRSRTSDDQDVPDDIHLPQPRLQVVRRSLDIQERPDETERKETERKVDEKEPLPFLSEGTSDQGSDGTGERPDATDDPGENASFG